MDKVEVRLQSKLRKIVLVRQQGSGGDTRSEPSDSVAPIRVVIRVVRPRREGAKSFRPRREGEIRCVRVGKEQTVFDPRSF